MIMVFFVICQFLFERYISNKIVKTQTNKPEWQTIFLKHFLKQLMFQKQLFETKTLPRLPLFLSEHADVV